MRRKIVASSWKMHINSLDECKRLSNELKEKVGSVEGVEMFILPTYPIIQTVGSIFQDSKIAWGAQNVCFEEKGAYTGEVPIQILKDLGCKYVEMGHAERKSMFNETDPLINKKVKLCEKFGLIPVICIGETQENLDNNVGKIMLKTQVLWALDGVNKEFIKKIIFAYEPVWAIGKAEAASSDYVQETHTYIRKVIEEECGEDVAKTIRIIYGGSVSPETAPKLLKCPDVDGLFIGRFGLKSDNFKSMVESAL
jgi:triosephosphate isomerase